MDSGKLNLELPRTTPQPGTPRRLSAILGLWRERYRQRTTLAHLDELAHRDLGITDADVWREAGKPPWQA
jgi:uncharacterized protein YjiS (DUF1127 family)